MPGRRIVIVRHGERVDFTFGDIWIERCFGSDGGYRKHNLNMPDNIVKRAGLPMSYRKDCPLTQVGLLQGKLVGKGLLGEKILQPGFDVYVSPALRSVQTAAAILEGMDLAGEDSSSVVMKVEPCLFEWTGWYVEGMPSWATNAELVAHGYRIDGDYEPFTSVDGLEVNESVETYFNRTHDFVRTALAASGNDLLLVGHGSSLDVATRQLSGLPVRSVEDMLRVLHNVPYAGLAIAEQTGDSKKWGITKPGNLTLRHSSVNDFDAFKNFSC